MGLTTPLSSIPQIGPKHAALLLRINLNTVSDLLQYYPFRYQDYSQLSPVASLKVGDTVTLTGQVISIKNVRLKGGRTLQQAIFSDGQQTLPVSWFNQPYLIQTFTRQPQLSLSGKVVTYRGHLTLVSPQYESLKSEIATIHTGRLVPIYHEIQGLSSHWLRQRLKFILNHELDQMVDWLPQTILSRYQLIDLKEALHQIHFPSSEEKLKAAIHRLSFNELFLLQLVSVIRKHQRLQLSHRHHQFSAYPESMSQFIQSLPFTPTPDQLRSLQEITSDLTSTISMNRLLQGDVGSGKTMVAAAAIYLTFLNRLPSVIMAPTTILANQHFHNLHKMLNPFGVKLSLVTQTTPTFKPADVYIGTHALLHRHLPHPLGLVVIDEQHRFGVVQRSQLIHNDLPPHLLSMTATPIPRTIALTLYSELDLSVIDTLPPGRTPVKTIIVPPHKRQDSYTWLSDQITTNQAQVFVVCPLINDSVSPLLDQVKAVTSTYNELKQRFPQFRLGELHGQLKNTEKDQILAQFQNHQLDILVSTPVIEVGIDIPQATIMIIEAPERFGLAQLHQLRGRVGRGGDQPSYCLLYPQDNPPYSARLTALTQTHSGKELAELDLKLRGPGDLYGLKQSGYLDLKIASLADVALVHDTHQAATTYFTQNHHSLPVESPLSQELESLLAKPTAAN